MRPIRILTICLAALVCGLAVSCQPEEPEIDFQGSTSLAMKAEGGSQNVGLTTNYEWTAKASDPWIHVSPSSGQKGSSSISIRVDANTTGKSRRGSVSVTSMTLTRSIDVSQEENPTIDYSGESTIEIDADGGSKTISLSSNNNWEAKSSESWLKVEPTSGNKGSFTLKLSADANKTGKVREAIVTVSCLTASVTVKVTQ